MSPYASSYYGAGDPAPPPHHYPPPGYGPPPPAPYGYPPPPQSPTSPPSAHPVRPHTAAPYAASSAYPPPPAGYYPPPPPHDPRAPPPPPPPGPSDHPVPGAYPGAPPPKGLPADGSTAKLESMSASELQKMIDRLESLKVAQRGENPATSPPPPPPRPASTDGSPPPPPPSAGYPPPHYYGYPYYPPPPHSYHGGHHHPHHRHRRESSPPPPPPPPPPAAAAKGSERMSDTSYSTISSPTPVPPSGPPPPERWDKRLVEYQPDDRGPKPMSQLSKLFRAIANHLIKEVTPKESLVVTAPKMIHYYQTFSMEQTPLKEDTDWAALFNSPQLSQILCLLRVPHHLTGMPPTIPGLTPAGFETWCFTVLMTDPEREVARLNKFLSKYRLPDLPTDPLPRSCFPERDVKMANAFDRILEDNMGSSPGQASLVIVPSPAAPINPTDYLTPEERTASKYRDDRPTLGDDAPPPSRTKPSRHKRGRSTVRRPEPPSEDDDEDGAALYDGEDEPRYPYGREYYRREQSRPPPGEWEGRRAREQSRPPARADGADYYRGEGDKERRRYSHSIHHHAGSGSGSRRSGHGGFRYNG